MIPQGVLAARDGRGEQALHAGAPRDIGRHAATDGGRASAEAASGPSAGDALRAVGRRLSSPFRGRGRGGAPGAAAAAARRGRGRSNWWFLLPIFLHATGGIVAFFILREDDVRKARNCLYLGLSLTALMFAPLVVLAALAGSSGVVD